MLPYVVNSAEHENFPLINCWHLNIFEQKKQHTRIV